MRRRHGNDISLPATQPRYLSAFAFEHVASVMRPWSSKALLDAFLTVLTQPPVPRALRGLSFSVGSLIDSDEATHQSAPPLRQQRFRA